MFDFINAELTRFADNPFGQIANWITIVGVLGVAIARPLVRFPVMYVGTAKVVQFIVMSAVIAVAGSLFQANAVAHFVGYFLGLLVVAQLIVDNWLGKPNAAIGALATYLGYNGFFLSLVTGPFALGLFTVMVVVSIFAIPLTGVAVAARGSPREPS